MGEFFSAQTIFQALCCCSLSLLGDIIEEVNREDGEERIEQLPKYNPCIIQNWNKDIFCPHLIHRCGLFTDTARCSSAEHDCQPISHTPAVERKHGIRRPTLVIGNFQDIGPDLFQGQRL
jgi:hypothetical protein